MTLVWHTIMSDELHVDTNIPIPPRRPRKWEFEVLKKVGNSFLAEGMTAYSMSGHVWRASKRLGWKFETRTEYDKEGKLLGCRVWRVK
jgi:hypothetical protein